MGFADIEAVLLAFFGTRMPGVRFEVDVPADRPAEFVLLRRNGGPAANRVVDRPLITVDAWAASSARAAELVELVRGVFLGEGTTIPRVRGVTEISGPYNNPDDESGSPRYRFSVQLTVRAVRS